MYRPLPTVKSALQILIFFFQNGILEDVIQVMGLNFFRINFLIFLFITVIYLYPMFFFKSGFLSGRMFTDLQHDQL